MTQEGHTITFLIAKCSQRSFQLGKRSLDELGITPAQAMVLKHLCQKDGISQYELGEVVRKDRSTISNILRRLEAVGLVTRTPDPNDRRSWLVYVTPKGLSLKGTLEKKLKEINEILTEALTQQEISNLRVYLEKIRTKKSRRQSE